MKCTATKVQAVKTITEPLNIEGAEGVAAPHQVLGKSVKNPIPTGRADYVHKIIDRLPDFQTFLRLCYKRW